MNALSMHTDRSMHTSPLLAYHTNALRVKKMDQPTPVRESVVVIWMPHQAILSHCHFPVWNTQSSTAVTDIHSSRSTIKLGCMLQRLLYFDSFSGERHLVQKLFHFLLSCRTHSLWAWGCYTQKTTIWSPYTTAPWVRRKRTGEQRKVSVGFVALSFRACGLCHNYRAC